MGNRIFSAALFMFALIGLAPGAAVAAPVTGFAYNMPKLSAPDPALSRYLQQDRAKVYRDYAALFADPDLSGEDFSGYESTTNWTLDSILPGLKILLAGRSSFTGGAHGYAFVDSLIWDSKAGAPISFAGLFSNAAAARALLNPAYCRALDRERLARRGEPTPKDDMFGACPDLFKEAEAYPATPVYGKYSRIAISLAPYVGGPYSEGTYDLEIVIPKGLKALVKPQYQALFPG
jgi:hypothetical protein